MYTYYVHNWRIEKCDKWRHVSNTRITFKLLEERNLYKIVMLTLQAEFLHSFLLEGMQLSVHPLPIWGSSNSVNFAV